MHFEERSYSGESTRPRPECYFSESEQLLIVATPWGAQSSAQRAIEKIKEFVLTTREDNEITFPFERLTSLSTAANNVRIGALLANDSLYRNENKHEINAGVEVAVIYVKDQECVWLHVGQPSLFLDRPATSITPISTEMDLSFEMAQGGDRLPPLPSKLLGLDSNLNFSVGSFRRQPEDKIILLSRTNLPTEIYYQAQGQTLEQLTQTLAHGEPQMPFWLGMLQL